MGILIGIVIATIIITGVYVGYNYWEASLHEEAEKHSEPINWDVGQKNTITLSVFHIQADLNSLKT